MCISSLLMGTFLFLSWASLPGWIRADPKSCKCIFLRKIRIVINGLVTHSSSFKYFKDICILKLEIEISLWRSLFFGCWLHVKAGRTWSTILALAFYLICYKPNVVINYLKYNQELQILLTYIDYNFTYQSLPHYIWDVIHHLLSSGKDCQKSSGISGDF